MWMNINSSLSLENVRQESQEYARSHYLRDYGMICHSSAFRRLSHKTQVYANSQLDFVRTRLTHSIEASQIGRQLARFIARRLEANSAKKYERQGRSFERDLEDLVAAACLAHDIGHPPFGHRGQKVLEKLCQQQGEDYLFDDNKQVLRILLSQYISPHLEVTCSLADAVIKKKNPLISAAYKTEIKQVEKIISCTGTGTMRNPASYLMEAADDISYVAGDIEDALWLGLFEKDEREAFNQFAKNFTICDENSKPSLSLAEFLEKKPFKPTNQEISSALIRTLLKFTCDGLAEALPMGKVHIDEVPSILHEFITKSVIAEARQKGELNFLYWNGKDGTFTGERMLALKQRTQSVIFKSEYVARQSLLIDRVVTEIWEDLISLNKTTFEDLPIFRLLPNQFQERLINNKSSSAKDTHSTFGMARLTGPTKDLSFNPMALEL